MQFRRALVASKSHRMRALLEETDAETEEPSRIDGRREGGWRDRGGRSRGVRAPTPRHVCVHHVGKAASSQLVGEVRDEGPRRLQLLCRVPVLAILHPHARRPPWHRGRITRTRLFPLTHPASVSCMFFFAGTVAHYNCARGWRECGCLYGCC